MAVTWESPASCPSLGSPLNSNRGPQSETLWDLDVAKSDCHILSSLGGETRKSPRGLEKCQQNCKIKATFIGVQSSRSWMVQRALCRTESTRSEAKVEVRMPALHSKKRGTQPWPQRGKYSYPVPPSIILSFYPQCIAKWIKDTLRSSKNSFCTPIIFLFHRHCGERYTSLNP